MDLKQRKLNKSEWDSIEVPVSQDELEVLKLIQKGAENVNIKYNKIDSLFSFLKIEVSEEMEDYLYNKYFAEKVQAIVKKSKTTFIKISVDSKPKIKKADLIRLEKNTVEHIQKLVIQEQLLIRAVENILFCKLKDDDVWTQHYYSLFLLTRNTVPNTNRHITSLATLVLAEFEEQVDISYLIRSAVDCVEKNDTILKYGDMNLYEHQKEIFTVCKHLGAKLVLYIAPTGTGKTLTPIGLSETKRVIFVCAARHVGLALARAAISAGKKIAFAFGCGSAADIRLHYFAAKEVTRNYKTGGIWKVDNSIGDKVEIMICDIKSYLPAMLYMCAFNEPADIITFWDEPTITFDYAEHEFHPLIQKNWKENMIPNMVLSSATLPKQHEIPLTVADFMMRFPGATICNIVSNDCKKSIPIINNNGQVVLPHYLFENYDQILETVRHCENYLTLLRYFDLKEVVRFIQYVNEHAGFIPKNATFARYFGSLEDITMIKIKLYYLKLLKSVDPISWPGLYQHFQDTREKRIQPNTTIDSAGAKMRKIASVGPGVEVERKPNSLAGAPLARLSSEQPLSVKQPIEPVEPIKSIQASSGNCAIYVTTKDAYTLTDGPTIFLAQDVEKIAKFCIQQANIPAKVMADIEDKLHFNSKITEKIDRCEKDIEDLEEKKGITTTGTDGKKNDHKLNRQNEENPQEKDIKKTYKELEMLRSLVKVARLNELFVPNMEGHLKKWAEELEPKTAFTSKIEDAIISQIMAIHDVKDSWKVLLLMGIGVFTNHNSIEYTEVMKNLADQQRLYLIIASSDYIYGTNYQFCHGYLSKDLQLTQEKIIQAMGRIGRNNVQQDYTARFRDDEQIVKLFTAEADKPEIINMNTLFNGNSVKWNGQEYEEVEEPPVE